MAKIWSAFFSRPGRVIYSTLFASSQLDDPGSSPNVGRVARNRASVGTCADCVVSLQGHRLVLMTDRGVLVILFIVSLTAFYVSEAEYRVAALVLMRVVNFTVRVNTAPDPTISVLAQLLAFDAWNCRGIVIMQSRSKLVRLDENS